MRTTVVQLTTQKPENEKAARLDLFDSPNKSISRRATRVAGANRYFLLLEQSMPQGKISQFVVDNLRLQELSAIVDQNKPFYDAFVSFLQNLGYADVAAFIHDENPDMARSAIESYLANPAGTTLYDGLGRPYTNSKAKWYFLAWILRDAPAQRLEPLLIPVKTRETIGGGHANLFTRDIFKSVSVAQENGYLCIPVVIAASWGGDLKSLNCKHLVYIQANPNQAEHVAPKLASEFEALLPVWKEFSEDQ